MTAMEQARRWIGAAAALALAALSPAAAAQETGFIAYGATLEQLEYRAGDGGDVQAWDGDAFAGTDEWRFVWQSEGEYDNDAEAFETLENQLLVRHPIGTFFDIKAGVRFDTPDGDDRVYAVLGLQGLAPQFIEVDADLFLSERGAVSFRIDADYEALITNRLILTPTVEIDIAASDDDDVGVGSGLVSTELGLRLRYELIDRALAPYVGVFYERLYGESAALARDEGEDEDGWFAVAGVRLMF